MDKGMKKPKVEMKEFGGISEMPNYAIYYCGNSDCPMHKREVKKAHYKGFRFATGRSPSCSVCGQVLTYVKDAEDDWKPKSPFDGAMSTWNPFKDVGVGKRPKEGEFEQ